MTPPNAAACSRWDGRPRTPPFRWADGAGGEPVAAPDAWLSELDPAAEGLGALQEPEFLATDPGAGAADLARVKDVLVANAGTLQMLFLQAAADASTPVEGIGRMTLAQLKALLTVARVVTPGGVSADAVDRAFAKALGSPGALARCAPLARLAVGRDERLGRPPLCWAATLNCRQQLLQHLRSWRRTRQQAIA
jgi:hypothetical protein